MCFPYLPDPALALAMLALPPLALLGPGRVCPPVGVGQPVQFERQPRAPQVVGREVAAGVVVRRAHRVVDVGVADADLLHPRLQHGAQGQVLVVRVRIMLRESRSHGASAIGRQQHEQLQHSLVLLLTIGLSSFFHEKWG